jgi:dolichyl-phosphate beta-glucosyltransferase
MSVTTLVVPCYNESRRLDVEAFKAFVAAPNDVHLVLVNDGSRDNTVEILNDIRATAPERVTVLDVQPNGGKANAVRLGMLKALDRDTRFVGFWDADLATPFDALPGFIDLLSRRPELEMVIGSRVRLLGRFIERNPTRHYAGRFFATAASLTLRLPVYDTQCGAKLFRASPRLRHVLESPFLSKWIFDVEIIARYGALRSKYDPERLKGSVYEYPLLEWRDVKGSALRGRDFMIAGLDLLRIYRTYILPGAPVRPYSEPDLPTRPRVQQ